MKKEGRGKNFVSHVVLVSNCFEQLIITVFSLSRERSKYIPLDDPLPVVTSHLQNKQKVNETAHQVRPRGLRNLLGFLLVVVSVPVSHGIF